MYAGESAERPETDDEGIERDSGDSDDDRISSRAFNFDSILDVSSLPVLHKTIHTNYANNNAAERVSSVRIK